MVKINRAEGVYFKGDFSRKARIFFPENLRLRNKTINYIYAFASPEQLETGNIRKKADSLRYENGIYTSALNYNEDDSVLTAIDSTAARGTYVCFVNSEDEVVKQIPLPELYRKTKCGIPFVLNEVIDYDKSYIENHGGAKLKLFFVFAQGTGCQEEDHVRYDHLEVLDTDPKRQCYPEWANYWEWSPIGVRRLMFPDVECFRGKSLKALNIHCSKMQGDFDCVSTPANRMVFTDYIVNRSLLTLTDNNGDEIIYNVPLCAFRPDFTTNGALFGFADLSINWKRCYIEDYSDKLLDLYKSKTMSNISCFYFSVQLSK